MAVSGNKYTYTPLQNTAQETGNGLVGVSQNTKDNVTKYQAGYTPSDTVTQAQNTLASIQNGKPGDYASQYAGQLDNIMAQITNPEQFKYNFNDDEMFKYYADLYTEKGRQASADAMGQAAALTGGYGNSYAQSAGNQAYQQYLLSLYDKGTDFMNQAYQRYADDRANNYNILNALQNADQIDYSRYRDTVSDWENQRDYWTDYAQQQYQNDYGQYQDLVNYWNTLAQQENADYWTGIENANQIAQQNAANQLSYDQLNMSQANAEMEYAYKYATAMLAAGKMPSAELLAAAGLSAEDAAKLMPQTSTGSSSGNGNKGNNSGNKPQTYVNQTPTPEAVQQAANYLDSLDANEVDAITGATAPLGQAAARLNQVIQYNLKNLYYKK